MKQLVNKLRRKAKPAPSEPAPAAERITNETVAEHRERILAGGRKFKYPMQHPKHHIVLTTVLIMAATLLAVIAIFTWQLYRAQATGRLVYSATAVVPFPVARVDGSFVRYSDYLLELRSALHYLSTKENINFASDDGKRQLAYQKRWALAKAEQDAYARKLAKQYGIAVTGQEVDDFVGRAVNNNRLGVNERAYAQVIRDYYDWSMSEYKHSVADQLLLKKVVAKVDTKGRKDAENLLGGLRSGADFAEVAKEYSQEPGAKQTGGDVPAVPLDSDDPNGLIAAAQKLRPGQVSGIIEGIDGFYIIKLHEKSADNIHFSRIFIAYSQFEKQFDALKKDGKIHEYITVAEDVGPTNR